MKAALRSCYIHLLPEITRMRLKQVPGLAWLRDRLFHADTRLHDAYYTADYYRMDVMEPAAKAAEYIAEDIAGRFGACSALDVGCGSGEYMQALARRGVAVRGVDLAEAAIHLCRDKGLEVQQADLTRQTELPWQADLVYSFEVAEHLPESAAPGFVRLLCQAARDTLIITAAGPGQPGLCHQNCQPKSYWQALFADHGFVFDEATTAELESSYRELELAPWLFRNLLVLRRG
jgi:2-polyprenyl-3-methyl-5-hydroxy-6-metoxy-1,4-benzoquinol methylase